MKKAENGFDYECTEAKSALKNGTTKTESHPGKEK